MGKGTQGGDDPELSKNREDSGSGSTGARARASEK